MSGPREVWVVLHEDGSIVAAAETKEHAMAVARSGAIYGREHTVHPYAARADENGCCTLPDGSCVSDGPCIHAAAPPATPDATGTVWVDAETMGMLHDYMTRRDEDRGHIYPLGEREERLLARCRVAPTPGVDRG